MCGEDIMLRDVKTKKGKEFLNSLFPFIWSILLDGKVLSITLFRTFRPLPSIYKQWQ
jgi:hypothetical protein